MEDPPASQPRKQAPWWASWGVALIAALGGGAGIKAILGQGEEQIRLLTQIEWQVNDNEKATESLGVRMSRVETYNQRDHIRDELAFQAICSALEEEGYRIRGMDCQQVGYAPTQNKLKPRQAVTTDGRELEVPEPSPPPVAR